MTAAWGAKWENVQQARATSELRTDVSYLKGPVCVCATRDSKGKTRTSIQSCVPKETIIDARRTMVMALAIWRPRSFQG